jgi:hypothetical protein
VNPELVARLAAYRIELLSEAGPFCVLARDNCFVLARAGETGLEIGSSGIVTENGLAYLVWHEGEPRLAAKGSEVSAGAAQVDAIRSFSEDLKRALLERAPGS